MLLSSPSLPIPQYSSEQRSRAKLALELHEYNHDTNQSNGHACENGIIPLPLTGQDFTAADDLHGACGACVSKRNSTITHGSISTSPPPITAGQLLHADLLRLEDGSLVILTKDDYCGFLRPVKLFGGKTKGAVQAGWDKIRLYYNERGFVLSQVNTDSEEIFKESAGILQERGILCSLSPPEVHEKSLERSWQTVDKRMGVVRQSLEYELPLGLEFTLLEHVCDILNSSGNSKFPHSSPHIIVDGRHNTYGKFPGHLPIPFGRIVQSRESTIVPQTGIVVGVTSNSTASQKVYCPSYDHQKGATILHRRVTELTVIKCFPREWGLVAQIIPPRGPVSEFVPEERLPVEQPVLNPLSALIPLPLSVPHDSNISVSTPLIPVPLPIPDIYLFLLHLCHRHVLFDNHQ
jgi:hypothetical protein